MGNARVDPDTVSSGGRETRKGWMALERCSRGHVDSDSAAAADSVADGANDDNDNEVEREGEEEEERKKES